jgi:hypothetical protein
MPMTSWATVCPILVMSPDSTHVWKRFLPDTCDGTGPKLESHNLLMKIDIFSLISLNPMKYNLERVNSGLFCCSIPFVLASTGIIELTAELLFVRLF